MKNKEELIELEHKFRMQEIEERHKREIETEKMKFDFACQIQRIKNADIRRTIESKENRRHMESYAK